MKRTELAVGMEVYYVENSWEWTEFREDVAVSRATVVDLEHYARTWNGRVSAGTGKHIHVQTPSGSDRYVTAVQLKGVYAEVAPGRLDAQKAIRERRDAAKAKKQERQQAVQAVTAEAAELGFITVTAAYKDRDAAWVELTAAELHALLSEVHEHRRQRSEGVNHGPVG